MRHAHQPLLGVAEEVGELSHAHLKWEQGIRGSRSELEAKAKDAVGDVVVFLADYCNLRGFDLGKCVEGAWEEVSKRRWKKHADPRISDVVDVSVPGGSLEVKEYILTDEAKAKLSLS